MSKVSLVLLSIAIGAKMLLVVMAQQPSTVPLLNTAFSSESSASNNIAPVIRIRQPSVVPSTVTRRSGSILPSSNSNSNLEGEETANYVSIQLYFVELTDEKLPFFHT